MHKVCRHAPDVFRFLQVDDHVEAVSSDEALPAAVGVGPTATQTVGQRGCSGGRVVGVEGMVVSHFFAIGFVFQSPLQRFFAVAPLFVNREGADRLRAQPLRLLQNAGMEVGIVLRLVSAPADFRERQHAWIEHIFRMFRCRNVFCPEVALYARHVFLLFLCQ